MGTKFWPMNRNRSYVEMEVDNIIRVVSGKNNCNSCHGRIFAGRDITTDKFLQCQCVKFESIGVSIAGNVTLTRKDN